MFSAKQFNEKEIERAILYSTSESVLTFAFRCKSSKINLSVELGHMSFHNGFTIRMSNYTRLSSTYKMSNFGTQMHLNTNACWQVKLVVVLGVSTFTDSLLNIDLSQQVSWCHLLTLFYLLDLSNQVSTNIFRSSAPMIFYYCLGWGRFLFCFFLN